MSERVRAFGYGPGPDGTVVVVDVEFTDVAAALRFLAERVAEALGEKPSPSTNEAPR